MRTVIVLTLHGCYESETKKPLGGRRELTGNIERLLGRDDGPDETEIVTFKVVPVYKGRWFSEVVLCSLGVVA